MPSFDNNLREKQINNLLEVLAPFPPAGKSLEDKINVAAVLDCRHIDLANEVYQHRKYLYSSAIQLLICSDYMRSGTH